MRLQNATCDSKMPNCKSCDNATACTEWDCSRFGNCEKCDAKVCTQCYKGSFYDKTASSSFSSLPFWSDGPGCVTCESRMPNCKSCDNGVDCTEWDCDNDSFYDKT